MFKVVLTILIFLPFYAQALDVTESKIAGKWDVESIRMGALGELPAEDGDFFKFENGLFVSSSQGKLSEAVYTLEENQIVISYPSKKEVFTVVTLTNIKMTFFVNVYVNGKKLSTGNISFNLNKSDSGD